MPDVLVLSTSEKCAAVIRQFLNGAKWTVKAECTYKGALKHLAFARPAVIVCDCPLDGGSWKDVLSQIAPMPDAPKLIVTCRTADSSLWSEVLNLGGFDMLAQPLDSEETTRVVAAAVRAWESRSWRKLPAAKTFAAAAAA